MLLAEKLPETGSGMQFQGNTRKMSRVKTRKPKLYGVIGAILMLVICNMVVQACVIQQDHQLKYWEKKIDEKERELVKLRMEIARLESFDRIQQIAQAELGMRDAGPADYYLIKSAPSFKKDLPLQTGYLAQASNDAGIWGKLSGWLGGLGRTMAKNP